MAFKYSTGQLSRSLSKATASARNASSPLILALPKQATPQLRSMATVPPVTQNSVGSKGPTAMVFLNMGGPSTTDEVGDFLSRLFVRCPSVLCYDSMLTMRRRTAI